MRLVNTYVLLNGISPSLTPLPGTQQILSMSQLGMLIAIALRLEINYISMMGNEFL